LNQWRAQPTGSSRTDATTDQASFANTRPSRRPCARHRTARPTSEGGLGVRAYEHPRGTAYGHGGTMAGYTMQLRTTRDGERIVIAAANSHSIPVMRAAAATVEGLL
jgi:hypothetical protein